AARDQLDVRAVVDERDLVRPRDHRRQSVDGDARELLADDVVRAEGGREGGEAAEAIALDAGRRRDGARRGRRRAEGRERRAAEEGAREQRLREKLADV